MAAPESTRPSRETREAEADEATKLADAGREPTPEEQAVADAHSDLDEGVSEHYEEMTERGADQEGEGRLP